MFRLTTRPRIVELDDVLQDRAFVVGLEIDALKPRVTAFVDAYVVFAFSSRRPALYPFGDIVR